MRQLLCAFSALILPACVHFQPSLRPDILIRIRDYPKTAHLLNEAPEIDFPMDKAEREN